MSANAARFGALEKRLADAGIPTTKAGFFDHPAFVAVERRDGSFLEQYARFVHWRQYDEAYLERAVRIIGIVSSELRRGLVLEGRFGGCIDTSMTMGRILDLYGVWNYVVRGGLRITFPAASGHAPFRFVPVEINDGSGKEFGHKWLFAPPFEIIDVTLKLQDYERPFHSLLPDSVLAKSPPTCDVEPADVLSGVVLREVLRRGGTAEGALRHYCPAYRGFEKDFPAHLVGGMPGWS